MISLRELQRTMAAALDGPAAAGPHDERCGRVAAARLLFDGTLPASERLAIYANNSWCAFRNTLELSFPAVLRLGGVEWFRGAARAYRAANPSRAGDLHGCGAGFPGFLREQLAGTAYEFVADVAALEWAYQQVLVAPDAVPFDVASLAGIAERDYGALRFVLAPSCALVAAGHPVLDLWRANRDAAPAGCDAIDLDAGPQRVLLRRHELEIELHLLDAPTYALLCALAAGEPLARAFECALALDAEFPLAATLRRYVALGVLGDARLDH